MYDYDNDYDYDRRQQRSSRRQSSSRSTYERRAQTAASGSAAQARRTSRDQTRRSRGDTGREGRTSSGARTQDAYRDDPRRGRTQRPRAKSSSQALTVPLLGTIIAFVVAILLTVLIMSLIKGAQINAVRKELEASQAEVESLTQRVGDLTVQLEAAQNAAASASSKKDKDSSSSTTKASDGVEDPWVESGYFTTGDKVLDKEVKEFCDTYASEDDSREDAALAMYQALAWADYVERDNAQEPAGPDWRNTYAHQYFENDNSGNCYEFAAALMYCLQYMGYEDAQAEAILILLQSGSWGDHGIVFVTNTDGSSCMCDTARGVDGWMIDTDTYTYKIEDVENNVSS